MFLARPLVASRRSLIATIIACCVAMHGFFIVLTPILFVSIAQHTVHIYPGRLLLDAQLLLALGLIYLSVFLQKRKRTAWLVTIIAYAVLMSLSLLHVLQAHIPLEQVILGGIRDITVPAIIISGLFLSRRQFTVRSDVRAFAISARLSVLVLLAALAYGVGGFMVLDRRDFHHEITIPEAIHRTIDQFDLTTSSDTVPYSSRAHIFLDSLSLLSTASVGFAFVSLFLPIRSHLRPGRADRRHIRTLIEAYPVNSEDYFKMWPQDKSYFFNADKTAGLAYGVRHGVALVVGDPIGDPHACDALLQDFDTFCYTNDWNPAYIHVVPANRQLYIDHDFSLQKIGEEAVVSLEEFTAQTIRSKYFRQIYNRFTKQGYTVATALPPHSEAFLAELRRVSNDWLTLPGRKERTFMMDSFNAAYMQQCQIVTLYDADGAVQGFLNQLPTTYPGQANFDLLRHSNQAPGNANDFILMEWIKQLHHAGFKQLNLGLCPLAGLDDVDDERSVTNNALRFVYANGDRFYSFTGLRRFKAKYNPQWESRSIAYRGGIRGFTRVLHALNRAMRP